MLKNKIYFFSIFIFILFIFLVFFTLLSFKWQQKADNKNENIVAVEIGGKMIKVELAKTISQQIFGLANREFLFSDQGMLFIYSDYQYPGFWMKGMLFPLDIIWLRDNKVIGWEKNVPVATSTNLQIYYPPEPINYVLEVPAGLVDNIGLEIGSEVKYY